LCRNCLLKHVTEGKIEGRIEVTGRGGRRRKQLLFELKDRRRRCKLREKALDHTLQGTRYRSGCGNVFRQTTE